MLPLAQDEPPAQKRFDVIVVGVGSMGASACWHLASRGYRVLGLEQFTVPHDHGSHTGQSRIVRKAYFEHPDYVPLLERAYMNWRTLEYQSGSSLYEKTGLLYAGPESSSMMEGVQASYARYGIAVDPLAAPALLSRFPMFRFPEEYKVLLEPDAGCVSPERTILANAGLALKYGAVIVTGVEVKNWKSDSSGIRVVTTKGTFESDKLVITAGGWSAPLIPGPPKLKVTRQWLAWISIKNPGFFSPAHFPCWLIDDPYRGIYYGFPVLRQDLFPGPVGLKIAHHVPGPETTPGRNETPDLAAIEEEIRYCIDHYLPLAEGTVETVKTCFYTYSEDENFIIDLLPESSGNVIIACGFSGHGFKFVPVVGEILADLAINGRTELPIDFLRLSRFSKQSK